MQKSIVSVLSIAVVLVAASGAALAQTYPPPAQAPAQTQPAQTPPAQAPAQTQPAQTPPAQTAPGSTGQMPSVANLKPFTIEADFMSLAGYFRYLMHQQTGQWMTYAEAQRAVKQGQ
jgi:hypothetical protein